MNEYGVGPYGKNGITEPKDSGYEFLMPRGVPQDLNCSHNIQHMVQYLMTEWKNFPIFEVNF